jgi:hypothetical protein
MSQVLTVPTHFNDIGELAEGFLDRVEHDTLILYGPVPYEDDSEIDFVVLLADGSTGLEGRGRVRAAVDGGAERVPETRYDVVVEALEFEGRYEVVFERLVMARQSVSDRPAADDEVPTGETAAVEGAEGVEETAAVESVSDVDEPPHEAPEREAPEHEAREHEAPEVEVAADEVSSIPPDEASAWEESSSAELSIDAQGVLEKHAGAQESQAPVEQAYDELVASEQSFEEAFRAEGQVMGEEGELLVAAEPNVGAPVPKPSMAAPPDAPPAPAGLHLSTPPEGLTRPSRVAADEELLASFEEAGGEETSGLFVYEEGLPIPSRPPLPDLNARRRVVAVEANDVDDVEDSEPPEADDEYEEIRLSEMAESAEEG